MRLTLDTYPRLVQATLERTAVPHLLGQHAAVILERLARGAGATRWFRVESNRSLELLCAQLSPGSIVSFYFDDRIAPRVYDDTTVIRILDLVSANGDAVVGTISDDDLTMRVEIVAGANELGEFAEDLAPGSRVFVGAFPAADNAQLAVTVTLPDHDGVTRGHPH